MILQQTTHWIQKCVYFMLLYSGTTGGFASSNTRACNDVASCVVQFPAKITDTDQSRLWYMHDRKFNVPKGEVLHLSLFYVNLYIL